VKSPNGFTGQVQVGNTQGFNKGYAKCVPEWGFLQGSPLMRNPYGEFDKVSPIRGFLEGDLPVSVP
jgi:hypothetical protein